MLQDNSRLCTSSQDQNQTDITKVSVNLTVTTCSPRWERVIGLQANHFFAFKESHVSSCELVKYGVKIIICSLLESRIIVPPPFFLLSFVLYSAGHSSIGAKLTQ